uniref:Uncharacterized protein n=1 Tax=Cucumis melo TaxID=3656 RepID=A0A9I9EEV4_CUCME
MERPNGNSAVLKVQFFVAELSGICGQSSVVKAYCLNARVSLQSLDSLGNLEITVQEMQVSKASWGSGQFVVGRFNNSIGDFDRGVSDRNSGFV